MKAIRIVLVVMAFSAAMNGQSKKIEIYDLIRNFAPGAGAKGSGFVWQGVSGGDKKAKAVWGKQGKVNLLLDGKPLSCTNMDQKQYVCKWILTLAKNKQRYSEFTLSTEEFEINNPDEAVKLLFGEHSSYFTLERKCIEGASVWSRTYRVVLPGKKILWMYMNWESASATYSQYQASGIMSRFYMVFYLDRKKMEANCD
jgi:hypothetical protein